MLRNIETPLPIYFCLWRRSSTYYGGEIFDPCPFSLDKRTQNTIISKYRPLASSVITFAEEVQNNDSLPHFSFSIEEGVQIIPIANLHDFFTLIWELKCWPSYYTHWSGGFCGCKILNLSSDCVIDVCMIHG